MADYLPEAIAWLDLETDGLDISTVNILEIGVHLDIVSNGMQFYPVWEGSFVIEVPQSVISDMDEVVANLHGITGLLQDIEGGNNFTLEQATEAIAAAIEEHLPGMEVRIGGSGVGEFDRPIIRRLCADLESRFHYRTIDLGVFRRMVSYLWPSAAPGDNVAAFGKIAHRALADALQSRSQFIWYRDNVIASEVEHARHVILSELEGYGLPDSAQAEIANNIINRLKEGK